MKNLLLDSFKQNPKALETLLATGNATLTHTQDKTKWGKEFPRLLMEVRNELRTTQPSTLPKTLTLKNGVSYSTTDIDIPLLESLGYSPEEMNEVFNNC
jgi:Holliday junction resolvasome RuvABC DNA-binding subunit